MDILKYLRKNITLINIILMGGGLMQLVAYGAQDIYLFLCIIYNFLNGSN